MGFINVILFSEAFLHSFHLSLQDAFRLPSVASFCDDISLNIFYLILDKILELTDTVFFSLELSSD